MKLLPGNLPGRLLLAALLATVLVCGLQWCVAHDIAEAAHAEALAAPRPPERSWPGLGFRLGAVTGVIGLAHQSRLIGPAVAPVVEILADGGIVLRRPAPLAAAPTAAVTSGDGLGAAIVLPTGGLAGLSPRCRTALLDVLQELIDERPVSPARLRGLDLTLPAPDLAALLAWLQ